MFVKCSDTSHLKRNDIEVTAYRLVSTKIVNEVLALRKREAGNLLKCSRFFYSNEMDYNEKLHTPSSEPFFYDTAYVHVVPKRCDAIPVNEKGECVENHFVFVGPKNTLIGWKCNDKCKALSKVERKMIDGLCVKLKRPINVIRNELDNIDVMCPHGHYERAGRQLLGHPLPCSSEGCFSVLRAVRSAAVHYPGARSLLWELYVAIRTKKRRSVGARP